MAQPPQDRPPGLKTSTAARLLVALLVVLASGFGVAPRWATGPAPAAAAGSTVAAADASLQGLARSGTLLASLVKAAPRPVATGSASDGEGDPAAVAAWFAPVPPSSGAVAAPRPWPSEVRTEASGQLTSRTPTGPPAV